MIGRKSVGHAALMLLVLTTYACNKNTKVGLQPLGNPDQSIVDSVRSSLSNAYGFEVYILPVQDLPEHAFINVKSPRYRADKLISYLRKHKADSLDFVMGITDVDISTTKRGADGTVKDPASKYEDFGIFGLGYKPGASSIISSFRLKSAGRQKLLQRIRKISVHELGHNLALPHCVHDDHCVMRDAAESIKTVDGVGTTLCQHCAASI